MNLNQHLTEKRSAILKAWHDAVMVISNGSAPSFLERQRTLVVDATGYDLERGIDGLFDALLLGVIPDEVSRFLDSMIRIRAAHDFTASQAVAFILEVKKAVRKELGNEVLNELQLREELSVWNSVVDDLVLFAFDIYVQHREAVLELKADEAKKETLRILKKAKLINADEE